MVTGEGVENAPILWNMECVIREDPPSCQDYMKWKTCKTIM